MCIRDRNKLVAEGKLAESPMKRLVSAVSVGILEGEALLDLCYVEDKDAEVDKMCIRDRSGAGRDYLVFHQSLGDHE